MTISHYVMTYASFTIVSWKGILDGNFLLKSGPFLCIAYLCNQRRNDTFDVRSSLTVLIEGNLEEPSLPRQGFSNKRKNFFLCAKNFSENMLTADLLFGIDT